MKIQKLGRGRTSVTHIRPESVVAASERLGEAITTCRSALSGLDFNQRRRVLSFVAEEWGIDPSRLGTTERQQ